MKLKIESHPSQRVYFLVVFHEDGQGLNARGTSTTIGQFRSLQQAEAAKEAVSWCCDYRFSQGYALGKATEREQAATRPVLGERIWPPIPVTEEHTTP